MSDGSQQLNQIGERTRLRVLILEDSEIDRALLIRALQKSGFELEYCVAENRAEFLQALENEFDLILADYTLSDLNAPDALRHLRNQQRDIPVIIVTGTVTEEVVVECIRLGASDYLLKDRLARLGDAIRQALRAWELREENRRTERELEEARIQAERDYAALLSRLAELAEQAGVAADAPGIYRALFDFCRKSTPADGFMVAKFDDATSTRRCEFVMTLRDGEPVEGDAAALPPLPLDDSPQSEAIRTGRVIVSSDLRPDAHGPGAPLFPLEEEPPRSSAAVPLRVQGRTVGAFEVRCRRPDAFEESHTVALTMAANHAAIALANVELLSRERRQRLVAESSERRYRELVNQASDGIIIFSEDGTVLEMNAMMRDLLGLEHGGVAAGNVSEWLVDKDSDNWTLPVSRLHAGHTVLTERRLRRPNGRDLPVETNTRRLADGNFQTIVRDISERKRAAEALLNEKVFSDTVINSLPGAFYMIDADFRIVRLNDNVMSVSGYEASELAGMNLLELFAERHRAGLTRRIQEVFDRGSASAVAHILTKDGKELPYFFSSVRLTLDGRTYLIGTGLDVSQQQEAEERERQLNLELEKRLARLSALHEIDMAITGSVDLKLTLDVVLSKVASELGVDACCVWGYEEASQTLRRVTSRGLSETAAGTEEVRLGEGPVGSCGLNRKPVRASRDELGEVSSYTDDGRGFLEYMAVPLISKGKLQGVLEVFGQEGLEKGDDWLEFLEALALQTAIAIDNVVLFQGLERSALDLTLAYDATIEGWARALDMRDHETEGHSRRVTELTVGLARYMGVDESELAHIRRGALLHDIGKLGVPDAILTKPGALDEEELEIMRAHARLGYELLSPIAFLRKAIDIPYCHHERWDGTGYPRGLRGEEIPLAARIFAAADVFDALTSNRPYRQAWSVRRALGYITERAGEHFDPEVARAFIELHGHKRSE